MFIRKMYRALQRKYEANLPRIESENAFKFEVNEDKRDAAVTLMADTTKRRFVE